MLFLLMDMVETPEEKRKTEALFNKYERLSYYVAAKILTNQQDIEDAVMDAWIKIIQNLDKISEISCPQTKSFVVIIVERTAINHLKWKKRHQSGEVAIEEYDGAPFFASADSELEDVEVYEILRGIPKTYSEVLILYYMHDYSLKEIADVFGISEEAAKKRLQRGRDELKKVVEL